MLYVFDTSSLREVGNMSPAFFPTFWEQFDEQVAAGAIVSVKEALKEVEGLNTKEHLEAWTKVNAGLFRVPTPEEMMFVREIFLVRKFQEMIRKQQRLQGMPVADPFLIAAAKIGNGCVVTEEKVRRNGAQIPNVCAHFDVECINFEGFLEQQGWSY